jgi:hypothetical protein
MERSIEASLAEGSVAIEMGDPKGMLRFFVFPAFLLESFAK